MCSKKILIVTNEFYPNVGGIQRFSENLAIFLSQQIGYVHVCALNTQCRRDENDKYVFHNDLWPLSVLRNRFTYFLINSFILLKTVVKVKPDIIISANYSSSLLNFLSHFLCKNIIVYVHGSDFMIKTSMLTRIFTVLTDKVIKTVIFNSRYTLQVATVNGYFDSIKKRGVIHPVFPSQYLFQIQKLAKGKMSSLDRNRPIIFLTVCKIGRRKGIDKIINAINESSIKGQIRYIIIGNGDPVYINELKEMISRLGLDSVVSMKHGLTDDELFREFVNSDIFAMGSYRLNNCDLEGFGIVYVEALFAGLVTVISKESGGSELKPFFFDRLVIIDPLNIESIKIGLKDAFDKVLVQGDTCSSAEPLLDYLDALRAKWLQVLI